MLVFVEGGKPENPEKNARNKDENQQQTQPTIDVESGDRTRATLVGGKCSHHCVIPASPEKCIKNVNEVLYSRILKCTTVWTLPVQVARVSRTINISYNKTNVNNKTKIVILIIKHEREFGRSSHDSLVSLKLQR